MDRTIICILFTVAMLAVIGGSSGASVPGSTSAGDGINTYTGYYTRGECDDVCPLNKNTVCKLDCLYINSEYNDCINHFYSTENGNPFWGCYMI